LDIDSDLVPFESLRIDKTVAHLLKVGMRKILEECQDLGILAFLWVGVSDFSHYLL